MVIFHSCVSLPEGKPCWTSHSGLQFRACWRAVPRSVASRVFWPQHCWPRASLWRCRGDHDEESIRGGKMWNLMNHGETQWNVLECDKTIQIQLIMAIACYSIPQVPDIFRWLCCWMIFICRWLIQPGAWLVRLSSFGQLSSSPWTYHDISTIEIKEW